MLNGNIINSISCKLKKKSNENHKTKLKIKKQPSGNSPYKGMRSGHYHTRCRKRQ